MAYTTTQLTTLEAALATGQLEVRYADKLIKYQSLGDMRKLRDEMKAELVAAGALATPAAQRVALATFTRD